MVKRFLFLSMALLGCFLSSLSLSAQKVKPEDVPNEVKQTLGFEHPTAKVSVWVLEEAEYVATFKEDGTTGKAYFKPDGDWVKSIFSIPRKQLPPLLCDYVSDYYPGFTYVTTDLRYVPDERLHYYIEVKPEGSSAKNISILTFNENGELLTREDPEGFISPVREIEKRTPQLAEKEKKKEKVQAQSDDDDFDVETERKEKQVEKKERYEEAENVLSSTSNVPESVKKEFSKKIPIPENTEWFESDGFFVAKCIYKGQKNEVFISQNGKWEKTYVDLPEVAVTGNMLKHLNSFHEGWKFKAAVREMRADKEERVLVDIYEKANRKQKLSTSILFDKAGKLITTFVPEYDPIEGKSKKEKEAEGLDKYYQKMSINVAEERGLEIPTAVESTFKAKYSKIKNPQWSEDGDNYYATYMGARGKEIVVIGQSGALLQTQTASDPSRVSDAIKSHIKKTYKGYQIEEFFSVKSIQDKQNLYRVVIKNKKTGITQDVWFTTAGKVIDYF